MNNCYKDRIEQVHQQGWTKFDGVFSAELIDDILEQYKQMEPEFIHIQERKGVAQLVENATHHSFVLCRKMFAFLENDIVDEFLTQYFEGPYILNTMGVSRITKDSKTYTQNIHRDIRSFTGSNKLWINTLIMLDDSTEENGATWLLEGSQNRADKPTEEEFYKKAIRATGKKGDVLFFDGNIWHAAGANTTELPRHIITPFYSKPYIKQQLDYPRALGIDFGKTLSPRLSQVLGYNAMVPVSLEEFYQPDEHRFYKSNQG